jgi:hypothetical protein
VTVRTRPKRVRKRKLRALERVVTVVGHVSDAVVKRMRRRGVRLIYKKG